MSDPHASEHSRGEVPHLYVLLIEDLRPRGTDAFSAHTSFDAAEKAVLAYVHREWAHELADEEMPSAPGAAIEVFFDRQVGPFTVSYRIEEVEMPGELLSTNPAHHVDDELRQQWPIAGWKYEVSNDDTLLGYATWLAHKIEAVLHAIPRTHSGNTQPLKPTLAMTPATLPRPSREIDAERSAISPGNPRKTPSLRP